VTTASPWAQEGIALVRAASGGLLFGVPLLYTMEVWWVGTHTEPHQMMVILGALLALLFMLNTAGGFREVRDVHPIEALEDSIEGVAVGVVATAAVLVLLRQITLDTPLDVGLGIVVNECVPFCLGVGVARFLLQGEPGLAEDDEELGENAGATNERTLESSAADLAATALGAAFIGLSIAPTDEVPMLVTAMSPGWLLLFIVASIVLSYSVVFVAGFSGQGRRRRHQGLFQHPVTETLVTYLVALAVGGVLLWVFQRELVLGDFVGRMVVLGLPTTLGGAVGRLAL
jgi:putative integral membrane protein (TIGR02587 family)